MNTSDSPPMRQSVGPFAFPTRCAQYAHFFNSPLLPAGLSRGCTSSTPRHRPAAPAAGPYCGMAARPPRTASAVAFQESAAGAGMASVPMP